MTRLLFLLALLTLVTGFEWQSTGLIILGGLASVGLVRRVRR